MSLKENDKSLFSGSFLIFFVFSSPAPIRKTSVLGFSVASLPILLMKAGAPCMSLPVLQALCKHKLGST